MRRVLAAALACAVMSTHAAAAPVEITPNGQIVLACDGAEVARGDADQVTAAAIARAVANGGKASCTATYPSKAIAVDLSALLCPVQPADQAQTATCPGPSVGSWPQTQTYTSAPAPTCWVASGFLPGNPPAGACNTPPTISGTPVAAVEAGKPYTFLPTVADPDAGDTRTFSIANKPTWAGFSTATGLLAGTPAVADLGISSSIVITVSDGRTSASTSAFSITVTAPPPAPVDCAVSAWSGWVLGTPSGCVNGSQTRVDTRTRTVTTPAANGGAACPALSESQTQTLPCTSPPPALTAPVLAVPTLGPNAADPTRFNIALNWSAVAGATTYEVRRCTGVACTGFTLVKTVTATAYTNTNLPAGFSYKYEVRAMTGTTAGPMSNVVTLATTPAPPPPPPPPSNRAPTIAGTPAPSVVSGQSYSFQPTAADADGDTLLFTIQNKPRWASFTSNDGLLTGTTLLADVGSYPNIVIAVSDGKATTNLAPFAIAVTSQPTGSTTLSWTPPTQNTDGSTLANLAGYKIAYGTSPATLTQTIQVSNPGMASYVVTSLVPGAWYFAVRAYTSSGAESVNSNVVGKVVQ